MERLLSGKLAFGALLLASLFLRLWGIGSQDFTGDEGAYAFRSLGYFDFLGTSLQTQPVDWYKGAELPAWTGLSFHDHPPLAFVLWHLSFLAFGDSVFAARFPGAFLGVVSVALLFFIVRRVAPTLALPAAFFFGVNPAMVWASRAVLIEPFLLFFLLLNAYCFFRFLEREGTWWQFGVTLGFVGLAKYTGAFLIPAYLLYLAVLNRRRLCNWRIYAAFLLAFFVMAPVIVYNASLFRARGHFDLQLAYLFGQETPEWTASVGKTQEPFGNIGANIVALYGIPFLLFAGAGFIASCAAFRRTRESLWLFLWLYSATLLLILVPIGSDRRFLSLFAPPLSIFAALAAIRMLHMARARVFFRAGAVAVCAGAVAWGAASTVLFSQKDFGVAGLDRYFEEEFRGKRSAVTPETDNGHLNRVIAASAQRQRGTPLFALIVYRETVALPNTLWLFHRRMFYQGIPVLEVKEFEAAMLSQKDIFRHFTAYVVEDTPNTLREPGVAEESGALQRMVGARAVAPHAVVKGRGGEELFRVYRFSI